MVTTKKIFKFLAKQGQHDQIARLLTANFGKPTLQRYNGPRGEGVMITLELNEGVSKRQVDRFLFGNKVAGAVARKNLPILKTDYAFDAFDKIGVDKRFIRIVNGKMVKSRVRYHDYGCTCCGGYHYFEE